MLGGTGIKRGILKMLLLQTKRVVSEILLV
jgi:hypothetical protein